MIIYPFSLKKVKVKVPVYSLISTHTHFQPTLYPPGTVQPTRAQPAHIDPTLDSCTRYPLLLGGQRHCRIRSLPKASTLDQLGNRTPDLSLSGPPPYQLGHELLLKWIYSVTVGVTLLVVGAKGNGVGDGNSQDTPILRVMLASIVRNM